MSMLISNELCSALNDQIGAEIYNSSLYLFIAGFLKNKGLDNLASLFEKQHQEELEHSKMIFDFLTDLNADVYIPEIDGVKRGFSGIVEIGKVYLEREIETTASLDEIKKMAIEQSNPVTEEFMREMIKLQRNEYKEATEFVDRAMNTGDDMKFVQLWDLSLG